MLRAASQSEGGRRKPVTLPYAGIAPGDGGEGGCRSPERPDENGVRLRDTQCGLFATGKVLRRFRVPFTYLTNCRLNDPVFERGIRDFLAVCNVVKTFRNMRILQISTRPYEFWSTMCNEGELLEKFNIQLTPIPMPELTDEMKMAK